MANSFRGSSIKATFGATVHTCAIGILFNIPHHHGWYTDYRSQSPDADVDDFSFVRGSHVQGFHWMADGDVPIHAHHGEGKGAGEHVIIIDCDHYLAEEFSKRPGPKENICALER